VPTFFLNKNVWKIKKTLKNVKNVTKIKKNVKTYFYIYGSDRGTRALLWKSNTQILRKIAFPSSQYELFGPPSQTLQWRPAVVLELGSTESARGADRTNQITGQDGSPSLYNEPMTLDPQTSEHENGSATKYLIRFGRGHTERLFIIQLIQRHAQVNRTPGN